MNLLDLFVKIGVKDEASGAIDDVSQGLVGKLASAAATAAKALAGAFVVKKVVEFGKAAYNSYANFQQLVGGIDKLYGEASGKMQEYAQQAWRTAGMDANAYMQSVTGFSASLITSLGGDTQKAADMANTAMQDISDNANMFGKYTTEELTDVYQALAKGQYQTLDNLQLGYGGSKEGMQQLIDKANELRVANGEMGNLSIDSFSDIVQAIHLVQEEMNITGTTEKEALKTLEGSANATKAAWQNLVTEFGKPDADIGARIADMFTAVMGVNGEGGLFRNVVNEVGTIASNMIGAASDGISVAVDYIRDNGPKLLEGAMLSVGDALERAWTALLDFHTDFNLVDAVFGEGGVMETAGKVGEWFQGIGQVIAENWPYIQDQLGMLWDEVVAAAETFGPQIMEVAGRLVGMARDAIVEHGPEILAKVGEVIGKVIAHIGTFVADMSAKGHEFMAGLITGTSDEGKKLHEWFANFFPSGLLKGLGDFATFLLDAGRALINGLLDGIGEVAPDVENAIRSAFDSVISFFETMGEFIQDPIGTIQRGFDALMGSSDDAANGVEKSMGKVEGSVDKSMTNASASLQKYNGTKLKDKSATAKVTGNAENGSAKKAVNDTNTAVQKLKDKSVSVDVKGNVTSGVAGGSIRTALDLIGKMKDKSVTLTTHNVTRNTKITETKQARGGIRRHARGDIFVANNPGAGVDLDVVKDITGEAGPEAIVPLTSHYGKDFAQMMGKEAAKVMGGSGTTVNIYMTYNAGEDATQLVSDIAAGLQLVL